MEKFIETYDDLLSPSFVDRIEKDIFSNKTLWQYQTNLDSLHDTTYFPGLYHHFASSSSGNITSYLAWEYMQVLYNFLEKKNIILHNIFNARAFLQIPSNGNKSPSPHIDGPDPHWVCLYYVNDSDGDTIFYKNDQKTEIKRVSPKKGRIVFFNGFTYHSAGMPKKNHRAVLNFVFKGEQI